MNPVDFPPLAALLELAASALTALGAVVTPAGAIVLVTLAVRTLLIPVGVSLAKAAQGRRRIAPQLAALQKRYRRDPQRLQRETLALYAAEKVSPLAGCLPMLAQLPVVSLVYALFASTELAGAPNRLLDASLFGAGLGRRLSDVVAAAEVGDLVFAGLAAVLALVAWLSRRMALRDAVAAPAPAADAPGAALLNPRGPLSWAPFLTLAALAVVPLAAALYLAVSAAWSYLERRVLRAVYA